MYLQKISKKWPSGFSNKIGVYISTYNRTIQINPNVYFALHLDNREQLALRWKKGYEHKTFYAAEIFRP